MSSEVQQKQAASRGRGSGRGGRGGLSSRGSARAAHKANGTATSLDALEDEGEIGELKKLYGSKTAMIREMFPDWSDQDLLFALKETDGDENEAVARIAEGTISQWGEVSNQKKDRARSKAKEATGPSIQGTSDSTIATTVKPGRGGRPVDGARGRGRAIERGARAGRGRSTNPPINGNRTKENQPLSVPTEESSAWNKSPTENEIDASSADTKPEKAISDSTAPVPDSKPLETTPAAPPVKTWASMLRQSTAPKAPPKPKEAPAPKTADPIEPLPAVSDPTPAETQPQPEPQPEPEPEPEPAAEPEPAPAPSAEPAKENLPTHTQTVADISHPPETETAKSEAADSWVSRQTVPVPIPVTPLSASQQQQQQQQQQAAKGPSSGFAATALKATERAPASRVPHTAQRRILEQEEAVRMPGNREVDRAAVQFGAFNLNGAEDDVDGDREEPETRAQPPETSPVAQPRASLPPVSDGASAPETFVAQKPTVALPPSTGAPGAQPAFDYRQSAPVNPESVAPTGPAAQQVPTAAAQGQSSHHSHQPHGLPPGLTSSPSAAVQSPAPVAQQSVRFGQPGLQDSPLSQKPYDPFAQPTNPSVQAQFEPSQPAQAPGQQPGGAFSSAPNDFSSYYTVDQHHRGPYNYYTQHYAQQQAGHTQQESPAFPTQQRPFAGYTAPQSDSLSQYPQSSTQSSRFGAGSASDPHNSGTTTPNPTTQAQHQAAQAAQSQAHLQQQPHTGQYPYNHPYYSHPYYSNYMNQYPGYSQAGYGGAPYTKGGLYGQAQYGMSPQGHYDHTASPAAGFGQSSLHRNDSGLGSGLGEYGRAGSAQSGSQSALGGSGFGSVHDSFARGGSYQSQSGQSAFGSQAPQPSGASSTADDLKPFGEAKTSTGGPSPAIGGARPGSAATNPASQAGLPPPQSSGTQSGIGMGAYSGYPGHLQGHGVHGGQAASGAYNMGGGAQHANSPYGGGYGGQGFGNNYYNQPRGWGGNYH